MNETLLVAIVCPDRPGLVSTIAAKLFDLGISLGDMSFSILGTGAEFTAICSPSTPMNAVELKEQLSILPELKMADIKVSPFTWSIVQGENAKITHRVVLRGRDQPGLVARLTEMLVEYEANIVTLKTDQLFDPNGGAEYIIQMAISIPAARTQACLASMSNTASLMQMQFYAEATDLTLDTKLAVAV